MRIRRYAGRENGLMLLASRSEWRTLAQAILDAVDAAPERADAEWPPLIAEATVEGARDYQLSCHLETVLGATPPTRLP
ncbi:MAG TPA: hypothetical protein VEA99_11975 [Gemmatimonadaceae bacterium]|nr:hypothetical protein [Gemmatimonadaceae bacterium]